MQNIKGILQDVIKSQEGMSRKLAECEALLMWDTVASSLAIRTQPVAISRGRMMVNVTDSVILHQLTFYKKEYIDKINLMLGRRLVKDIIFRVGKVEKREKKTESRKDYIKRLRSIKLEQDEITLIDEITDQIEDEEIRDSLRELFTSQTQLSKIRDGES